MTLPALAIYAALQTARAAWGGAALDMPVTITTAPLNDCRPVHGHIPEIAWSDFATRTITLNSACGKRWDDARYLTAVVTHELGHLIANGPGHSGDSHSIMFREVNSARQRITQADRIARKL